MLAAYLASMRIVCCLADGSDKTSKLRVDCPGRVVTVDGSLRLSLLLESAISTVSAAGTEFTCNSQCVVWPARMDRGEQVNDAGLVPRNKMLVVCAVSAKEAWMVPFSS